MNEVEVKVDIGVEGNKIIVYAGFADKDLVLTLPGARWDREDGVCKLPLTWNACKQLRGIFEERLEIGDSLYQWAVDEYKQRVGPCLDLRQATEVHETNDLCDGLYSFQQAGARFLIAAQQAILADPMGSGKTVQALAAARAIQERYERKTSERSMPQLWELQRCASNDLPPMSSSEEQRPETGDSELPSIPPESGRSAWKGELLLECPVHGELKEVSLGQFEGQSERCLGLHPFVCRLPSTNGSPTESSVDTEYVQLSEAERQVREETKGLTGSLPLLIVCPNSMKRTWQKEAERWWPNIPVYVVEGTKAQRAKKIEECAKNPGLCIINWEAVRLHSRLSPYGNIRLSEIERTPKELNHVDWTLIVADEAHRMKDPQSKQTRAVWSVAHNTPLRWAMTGTPVTNTPETLFPILHFLNKEEWPSKTAFINRYCDSAPSRWGPGLDIFGLSEETKEEFFEIFDPRFRRMPKEVVLPNLPPIQRVRKYVDMSDEQARGYRTMSEQMVAVDENGELIIALNPVSKLTRLIQYSSACIEMVDQNDGSQKARLTGPSCKVEQLKVDLDDYLGSGESVVVFAVSRQLIEMAEKMLTEKKIPYSVIKGNQSESERQDNIDSFQDGKVQVILVVIAAGGVGITLTAGRIAIFLQRSYSNVDMKQAEARIHRIGSERHESVIIVDYITNRTIENWQLNSLEGKAAQLEDIVRDRATIEKLLRGEEDESDS